MATLKRLKDMKTVVDAAPGIAAEPQQLGQFGGLPPAVATTVLPNGATNAAARVVAGSSNATPARRSVMITSMRRVGMMNFDVLVEFELTVMADGMPPYPATIQQPISQSQIGQLRPGMRLHASMDPSNPVAVWLDLTNIR